MKNQRRTWSDTLMDTWFYRFPHNIFHSFSGKMLLFHAAAVGITYCIVVTGFDWLFFQSSNNAHFLQPLLFPAVILGGLLPFIIPVLLYVTGRVKASFRLKNSAFALGQAAIIAFVISSSYKALTGRFPPEQFYGLPTNAISAHFRFGFWNGGIFHGWPSGHTTTAFAMAVTLIMLYPHDRRVRYLALAYALYIGFGISTNIHWFSDFVAGGLIGIAIGLTVGRSFSEKLLQE